MRACVLADFSRPSATNTTVQPAPNRPTTGQPEPEAATTSSSASAAASSVSLSAAAAARPLAAWRHGLRCATRAAAAAAAAIALKLRDLIPRPYVVCDLFVAGGEDGGDGRLHRHAHSTRSSFPGDSWKIDVEKAAVSIACHPGRAALSPVRQPPQPARRPAPPPCLPHTPPLHHRSVQGLQCQAGNARLKAGWAHALNRQGTRREPHQPRQGTAMAADDSRLQAS